VEGVNADPQKEQAMKISLGVALLSVCGLTAIVPAQARMFDGLFLSARDSVQQDRREARQSRRAKRAEQQEQPAEQGQGEQEYRHEPRRGYGYGYERRHRDENDGRGRR
jgi:hypothetical protein